MKNRGQIEIAFRTWGGKRRGAGRKQGKARRSEPHRAREPIACTECAHVVVRVTQAIGGLRRWKCYRAINRALRRVQARAAFRVVHASIQRTHVHLLVEAESAAHLANGMQGVQISAAKQLNRELGRPRGNVFVDRYHVTVIRSPVQCRHAIHYVLNNWRKHDEHRKPATQRWFVDAFSSAVRFAGWTERHGPWPPPAGYDPLAVCDARSWLLRAGWAKGPPISLFATPSVRPRPT